MATILVVDDNVDIAANMEIFLQARGHEVFVAHCGSEAYALMGSQDFDLLILDWDLPDTTGPEICQTYRDKGGEGHVLMLTGRTSTDDKVTGLTAGADDYLTKPVNIPEFGARVEALVRRASKVKKPAPANFDESMIGHSIAGYEISSVLGKGAMGVVFEAKNKTINRRAAIKVLSGRATGVTDRKRFEREAQVMSILNHPALIRIYDYGTTGNDVPYIVMEHIEGNSLGTILQQCGPLPVSDVLPLFIQVCEGLQHAHAESIIHRDLKPHNIMVSNDGYQAKILDLGVAKLADEKQDDLNLTFAGEIFGSPFYMSPEQATNKPFDHRTDIYSLGCVMYETLIGKPPFTAYSFVELINVKLAAAQPPSIIAAAPYAEFPVELDQLISKMMERKAEQRPVSVSQVLEQLRQIQKNEATSTKESKGKIMNFVQGLFSKKE